MREAERKAESGGGLVREPEFLPTKGSCGWGEDRTECWGLGRRLWGSGVGGSRSENCLRGLGIGSSLGVRVL